MKAPVISGATATGGVIAGSLVVLSLIPYAAGRSFVPINPLGLALAVAGMGGLLLLLVAATAATADRRSIPAILDAALLWSGCGLALCCAMGAVAATAESLQLDNVVLAQEYTRLFLVRRPVAALIYVVAVALAGQGPALAAILGGPSPARSLAASLLGVAMAALGVTLFAGGYSGPGLPPPLWLAVKTLSAFTIIALVRMALKRLGPGARLSIAWACAALGLAHLAFAYAMAMR